MPRYTMSAAVFASLVEQLKAMDARQIKDAKEQARRDKEHHDMMAQLQTQVKHQEQSQVMIRKSLGSLTNAGGGGKKKRPDALGEAGKRQRNNQRKGEQLTLSIAPANMDMLLDILRTLQKTLATSADPFYFKHILDSRMLAPDNDMLAFLIQTVLPSLKLTSNSFTIQDIDVFVEAAMGAPLIVTKVKAVAKVALNKSLNNRVKHAVLKSLGFDANEAPTDETLREIADLRGASSAPAESILELSERSSTDVDSDVAAVLGMEQTIACYADVCSLSQSPLFGKRIDDAHQFEFFNTELPLCRAAKDVYEAMATNEQDAVAYDALEPAQRVNMLVLTTAFAMSCVNVKEKKARGKDERELIWAPIFDHGLLATTVLPGVYEWMLDDVLCPTTNLDIIAVRN